MIKPIKFITTFSKTGYEVYGRTWIECFIQNTSDDNITADIYVDFDLMVDHPRIKVLNFAKECPEHYVWKKQYYKRGIHKGYIKTCVMKFSYKSFVMQSALRSNTGYVIWLDGDASIIKNDFGTFPENLLQDKFIAVQKEACNGTFHCESGIVIFDADHQDKDKFIQQFEFLYTLNELDKVHAPYDGFLIWKAIEQQNIDHVDLNEGYGRGGIQSDPNETFLNPDIGSRFYHGIGEAGKSTFENWNKYKNSDEYFRIIVGSSPKTPEEIKEIRQKLIVKRNGKR